MNPNTFLYNTGPVESIDDSDAQRQADLHAHRGPRRQANGAGRRTHRSHRRTSVPARRQLRHARGRGVVDVPGGGQGPSPAARRPVHRRPRSVFDLARAAAAQRRTRSRFRTRPASTASRGFNVHSVVLQVPTTELVGGRPDHRRVVDDRPLHDQGVRWTARSRTTGTWTQVSRLGMPLVNEVVAPARCRRTCSTLRSPATTPSSCRRSQDPGGGASSIPKLYPGVTVPPAPRDDLVLDLPDGHRRTSTSRRTASRRR